MKLTKGKQNSLRKHKEKYKEQYRLKAMKSIPGHSKERVEKVKQAGIEGAEHGEMLWYKLEARNRPKKEEWPVDDRARAFSATEGKLPDITNHKPTKCVKYIYMILLCEHFIKEQPSWSSNSIVKVVQKNIKYRKSNIQSFVSLYKSSKRSDKKFAYLHTEEYNDKGFECKKQDVRAVPYKSEVTVAQRKQSEAYELERSKYVMNPDTMEIYRIDRDEIDSPYEAEWEPSERVDDYEKR